MRLPTGSVLTTSSNDLRPERLAVVHVEMLS
jgi:hypothetical protein